MAAEGEEADLAGRLGTECQGRHGRHPAAAGRVGAAAGSERQRLASS